MKNNQQATIESSIFNLEYDYVEYYVGMAKMFAYWHVKALGFNVVAYCGPETGVADRYSYYLVKNRIKLVITSASTPGMGDIASFVNLHGNAIKRFAIAVDNVVSFFENAVENGAIPLNYPTTISNNDGSVTRASLKIFDDNELVLMNYGDYRGDFMPGYINVSSEWKRDNEDTELQEIDHVACALRLNESGLWENYFNNVFGSRTVTQFDERRQRDKKSLGMLLKVLQSENKRMNNVLVEPDRDVKSQVQTFVEQNFGSGIQHLAFASKNIFRSVELLRENGVRFTKFPAAYFDKLSEKHPELDIGPLKKYGVLCDVMDDALLFQIFTAPIGDRPTLFYEIVQRVNKYDGFGINNIYALFEALESELSMKGN